MQITQKELFTLACHYPWYLFTAEEISELCNVHRGRVRRAKYAKDSPFRFNKCRPEWFTDWMRLHPELKEDKLDEDSPSPRKKSSPKKRGRVYIE